jgi:hypothetical protein
MPPRKPPARPFLERFGGMTTWLLGIVVGGLFNTGIMYQQFQELKKSLGESREEQKVQSARLTEFREKQITGLADIQVLKGNVQNLDARVLVIERVFIERPAKEAKR